MDNKSYTKCKLCEYKGCCAFNHNGDQELCDLNVTLLDLADHDKQIRDEVIEKFVAECSLKIHEFQMQYEDDGIDFLDIEDIREIAEQMKGEQSE